MLLPKRPLAFLILTVLHTTGSGAFISPIAYTLTDVVSVNGSSANGDCPLECEGMASGIRRCDCRMTTIAEEFITGVLIDEVVPIIDTMTREWAAELYTVETTMTTFTIGFLFQSSRSVMLHEVELYVFYCPAWDIGADTISVYNGVSFPNFVRIGASAENVGSVTLTSDMHNCEDLTRVSIPLQMATSSSSYYIEFTNPTPPLQLYIAEVRFSDQPIPLPTEPATPNPSTAQTTFVMLPSTTERIFSTNDTTLLSITPANMVTSYSVPPPATTNIPQSTTMNITSPTSSTPDTPHTPSTSTAAQANSNMTMTTTNTASATEGKSPLTAAVVGALVGVILALLIFLVLGGVFIIVCYVRMKNKNTRIMEIQKLQDVVLENSTVKSMDSPEIVTSDNSHYETTRFQFNKVRSQSSPAKHTTAGMGATAHLMIQQNGSMNDIGYNTIQILDEQVATDTYDEIQMREDVSNNQYSTVAECMQSNATKEENATSKDGNGTPEMKRPPYSLIHKLEPPPVPTKSPELYKDLRIETERNSELYAEVDSNDTKAAPSAASENVVNPMYDDNSKLTKKIPVAKEGTGKTMPIVPPTDGVHFLGEYSEIEKDKDDLLPGDIYTEVKDSSTLLSPNREGDAPMILKNPVCTDMQTNPNYESADLAMIDSRKTELNEEGIYTNPDEQEEEPANIYDTVHSEPSIQPSMFLNRHLEGGENFETSPEEDEVVYSPIYSLTSSMSTSSIKQLTEANLKKVKTLGTGHFGKVILADTVDLSPKDLGLSDTDDDKSKSTRVAVKILKRNPSTSIKETFEKELKFMSRLNHPNVIKTLGACTTAETPFVVMEYMEKGDLNQYLQEFDAIIQGNIPPNNLEISVGTLTNMSAQVASAMKYLASRNFIHRDLATRNCLVGPDLEIKIADFGMSRNLYESHYYVVKGHSVLPVRWMARECFYGKFSAKSDVWSFGVTMWEMFTLTKDIPYEDMDDEEVVHDAAKKPTPRKLLERPKDCPQKVYDIMLMCWAVEPKERATFDELYQALSALSSTDQ